MTNSDRQRLKVLAILLVILCSSLWVMQKIAQPPMDMESSSLLNISEPLESVAASTNFQITDRWRVSEQEEIGDLQARNPFDYGFDEALPVSSTTVLEQVSEPPNLDSSLEPPPIPFEYNGYAIIDGAEAYMIALLFDGDESFPVYATDILIGRYQVNLITETFVEIEDLEFGHRRNLPLSIQ